MYFYFGCNLCNFGYFCNSFMEVVQLFVHNKSILDLLFIDYLYIIYKEDYDL